MLKLPRVVGLLLFALAIQAATAPSVKGQAPRLIPASNTQSDERSESRTRLADVRGGDRQAADRAAKQADERNAPPEDYAPRDVSLPNDAGQVWREYDIRPYTTRVEGVKQPELAVKDWILRETGTETWFHEPLSILSVNRDKVRVYHTPEMQRVVKNIIEQFRASRPEPHALGIRLVTLQSPNWRIKALPLMESVEVHSAGVEAWLVSRENAVILLGELKKRSDFQQHSGGNVAIYNGQSYTINRRQPRRYVKTVQSVRNPFPAHKPEMGEINEGYSLQLSALFNEQSRTVDTVIRCHVDQIERFIPVTVDLPGFVNQRQRIDIKVPQLVSWRLHERFVWPEDKVLVLSCGVVASPGPRKNNLSSLVGLPVPTPFEGSNGRADALLMIENNGTASQSLIRTDRTSRTAPNYHGRY